MIHHIIATPNPSTPGTIKAACQFHLSASQATSGGAMTAPKDPPATHRLFAVARKLPGNQTVTARNWAGNAIGSASPSIPRQKANCPKVFVNAAPIQALDQATTPVSIMLRAPHRSTSQPATGYMQA